MPTPEEVRVPPRPTTLNQEQRALEVEQFLARGYRELGYRIVATTQTYSGDIIDWVDPRSVPGSDEPPPPPIQWEPGEGPLPGMELVDYPELRGPEGTIPFHRPTYEGYVFQEDQPTRNSERFTSIERFIAGQVSGQPAGQFRLYGGYRMVDNIRATIAWLSTWQEDNVENDTFSLLEINAVCDGPNAGDQDLVGATVSRDRWNFGDPANAPARLQVEIYHKTSNGMGAFSRWAQAPYVYWVPSDSAPYGPGAVHASISQIEGGQHSYRFEWQLISGNWWLNHNGNWLGYYPGSLLSFFQTGSVACRTSWYGEVFDPTPTSWTATNMGSGRHANEGWTRAAYIRRPFYVDGSSTSRWAQGTGAAGDSPGVGNGGLPVGPADAACYTTSGMLNGGANWERYFYLGGPGGDATGCN